MAKFPMSIVDFSAIKKAITDLKSVVTNNSSSLNNAINAVGTKVDNKSSGLESCIKSVQRGISNPASSKTEDSSFGRMCYVDVPISDVDMNKCILLAHSSSFFSSTPSSPCIRFVNSTTIRVYKTSGGDNSGPVSWQVVEFY